MDNYFENQTLIAVAKDEKYLLLLKKYLDSKKRTTNEEEAILLDLVAWDEKVWLAQKKDGRISSETLLIGPIKGVDKLLPLIDVKFDKYGVKYGWSGRQAVISVDYKVLEKSDKFLEFVDEYNNLVIPEQYKIKPKSESNQIKKLQNITANIYANIKKLGYKDLYAILSNRADLVDKLLIYGVVNFYNNHLKEFMDQ